MEYCRSSPRKIKHPCWIMVQNGDELEMFGSPNRLVGVDVW